MPLYLLYSYWLVGKPPDTEEIIVFASADEFGLINSSLPALEAEIMKNRSAARTCGELMKGVIVWLKILSHFIIIIRQCSKKASKDF